MNAEILSLLILGGAALFGLQGSLAMAMRHYLFRNQSRRSACERLLGSPEAYIGPIPVALVASFYYGLVVWTTKMMMYQLTAACEDDCHHRRYYFYCSCSPAKRYFI